MGACCSPATTEKQHVPIGSVMRSSPDLATTIARLRAEHSLRLVSPFKITIDGKRYSFDCLLQGYGAKNGMVIDRTWSKIRPVSERLFELGYGYSCFDIRMVVDGMEDALEDWGAIDC